jgi:hypothetical protein
LRERKVPWKECYKTSQFALGEYVPGSCAKPGPRRYSQAEAERIAHALDQRHGESSREHMRRIFVNVPVIYGFTAKAPLGATAAPILNRYLESA